MTDKEDAHDAVDDKDGTLHGAAADKSTGMEDLEITID